MKLFFYILTIMLLFSCKQEIKKNTSDKVIEQLHIKDSINTLLISSPPIEFEIANKEESREVLGSLSTDTIYIKEREILFVRPTEEEYKLFKNEVGIEKVDSDFKYYASQVIDSLKGSYKISITSNRNIAIIKSYDTLYIDRITPERKRHKFDYAVLLINNNCFDIQRGVHSSADLYSLINSYFNNVECEKIIETKFIATRHGLNVRKADGTLDGKLENGEFVSILGYTDEIIEVEDNGKTIKGRWAIIRYQDEYDGRRVKKRYIFEGYLGNAKDVKLYDDQLCVGRKITPEYDKEVNCLADFFNFTLITKQEYDAAKTINTNFITVDKNIKKENGVIKLPIVNKTIELKDNAVESESMSTFEYYGNMDAFNAYLISGYYWEEYDYFWIDKTTGERKRSFSEYPYISPDKKTIITFRDAIFEDSNYVDIHKVNEKGEVEYKYGFELLFWLETSNINEVKWISNNTLIIKAANLNVLRRAGQSSQELTQYIKITIKDKE